DRPQHFHVPTISLPLFCASSASHSAIVAPLSWWRPRVIDRSSTSQPDNWLISAEDRICFWNSVFRLEYPGDDTTSAQADPQRAVRQGVIRNLHRRSSPRIRSRRLRVDSETVQVPPLSPAAVPPSSNDPYLAT